MVTHALLEAAIVGAQLVHENIVRFVGVVTTGRPTMLVLELCEHGSLLQLLRRQQTNGTSILSSDAKTKMLWDVCKGMSYLASLNFIHGDLAARNVLVDGNYVCKVTEFGLTRQLIANFTGSAGAHTGVSIPWASPEVLEHGGLTRENDIWSFSVLAMEVWTNGAAPYGDMSPSKILHFVLRGGRLACPPTCPAAVYRHVMKPTWATNPRERPAFSKLQQELLTLLPEEMVGQGWAAHKPRLPGLTRSSVGRLLIDGVALSTTPSVSTASDPDRRADARAKDGAQRGKV